MPYIVEKVTRSSEKEVIDFLKSRENYTLFLLNNFENYGLNLTENPYSGNFKLLRFNNEVVGVFCLNQKGSLLIETTLSDSIFDTVLEACQHESIPLKSIIGNWEFCGRFWEYLKNKKIITKEIFISKEVLYSMNLKKQNFSSQPNVRCLTETDYDQWKPLRLAYSTEVGVPHNLTDKQLLDLFIEKTQKKISWGFFLNDKLVSVADLNAKALDLGQVGGVYTDSKFRRKGYSKSVLIQLLHDAKEVHSIRKLVIFTGENNFSAQKLYLSLGVSRVGDLALLFGEPN